MELLIHQLNHGWSLTTWRYSPAPEQSACRAISQNLDHISVLFIYIYMFHVMYIYIYMFHEILILLQILFLTVGVYSLMTSWCRNVSRIAYWPFIRGITGDYRPLVQEIIGGWGFLSQRTSDAELWCVTWCHPGKAVELSYRWFEKPWRSYEE